MIRLYQFIVLIIMFSVKCFSFSGNIQMDFVQKKIINNSIDIVEGKIYISGTEYFVMQVLKPINQWIYYEGLTNLIYYPDENKVLRMINKKNSAKAMQFQLDSLTKSDLGLSASGFVLKESLLSNKVLITDWDPPAQFKNTILKAELTTSNKNIILYRIFDKKKNEMLATYFDEYTVLNKNYRFPKIIIIESHMGTNFIRQEIHYSNIIQNSIFPEIADAAKIPSKASFQDVLW